jgi:protein ImuA
VIGELAGNPRALDFTASRRLSLAAEKHGVPLYLVRIDARRDLSSARMRWDVRAALSPRPRWNDDAPGAPAWRAELFRARAHPPGTWILHDDGTRLAAAAPDHGDLAAAAGDRSLAAR